ncbi:uncharacterized protein P884DRAFT_316935 [Thermothelomyces heterothallicus CBS 202.75]|uniref:uncharacterized protein n=1 Tax=Thermothelomyces heterothallicus CBS 202.75 TaxID=1149848 RepID=UPI003743011A
MGPWRPDVHSALSLIESAGLPHPLDSLLSCFVKDAVDPLVAARYVHCGTAADGAPALVADWTYIIESITQKAATPPPPDAAAQQSIFKRDANRCCVTGKAARLWDPLVVVPILPVPSGWSTDKPRIFDMLGAFFGPPYRDWWLSYAQNPDFTSPYSNHWLVRRSAHRAWSRGLVCLKRLQLSMVEFQVEHPLVGPEEPLEIEGSYPLLGDHSRSGIEKVDPRFVSTHARLARSIRFVEIAKSLGVRPSEPSSKPQPRRPAPEPETNRKTKSLSPLNLATSVLLSTWLMFPSRLRVAVYDLLRKVGALLYAQPDHATVHRLPFGLYLKRQTDPASSRNEFAALRLLRRHTTVPVPRPLDVAHKPASRADPFSVAETYLVTTRVPGVPLYRCQHVLSDADLADLARQLAAHLAQLRAVPRPIRGIEQFPDAVICNTLGEAVRDPRIRGGEPVGPFADEAAFSRELMFAEDPARRGHRVVFTHADLNPRNILVERRSAGGHGQGGWVVSGIVDWENSGFYPDYWDCTKAFFEGFRWSRRYNDMVRGVFAALGDYEKELEVERRSWELGDGI